MLEQLQRLQTHITTLKTRLNEVESNNQSLLQAKAASEEQHHAQVVHKNSIITQKQDEVETLTEQLTQLQKQFKNLNTDATALADRYSRLEKSCTDLKNRFQEILSERNELRVVKEKMLTEQRNAQQEISDLNAEKARLIQKNDHAKSKVEAIIQRLSILGTDQDQHAQEIQQLAHPTDANEEV
jgi:predicted nuclease with TOPRIM domain